MSDFEHVLLRFKERTGVTSDKAVAELLGVGEKALNARKRRGVFPVDKLKALAMDKPELQLDVKFILTGVNDEFEKRVSKLKATTETLEEIDLPKRERVFLRDLLYGVELRNAALLAQTIEGYVMQRVDEAKGQAPPAPKTQMTFHGKVGQAAGNNIINKGRKR